MPITEKQKETIAHAFSQLSGGELVKVAGIVYQTILEAKLPSEKLMALGKLIFAGMPWAQIPNQLRFPFVKSTEEFMLREFLNAFEVVPDAEPATAAPTAPEASAPPAAQAQTIEVEGEIGGPEDQADDPELAAMMEATQNGEGRRRRKPKNDKQTEMKLEGEGQDDSAAPADTGSASSDDEDEEEEDEALAAAAESEISASSEEADEDDEDDEDDEQAEEEPPAVAQESAPSDGPSAPENEEGAPEARA